MKERGLLRCGPQNWGSAGWLVSVMQKKNAETQRAMVSAERAGSS